MADRCFGPPLLLPCVSSPVSLHVCLCVIGVLCAACCLVSALVSLHFSPLVCLCDRRFVCCCCCCCWCCRRHMYLSLVGRAATCRFYMSPPTLPPQSRVVCLCDRHFVCPSGLVNNMLGQQGAVAGCPTSENILRFFTSWLEIGGAGFSCVLVSNSRYSTLFLCSWSKLFRNFHMLHALRFWLPGHGGDNFWSTSRFQDVVEILDF